MASLPSGDALVAKVTEAYISADGELSNDELYSAAADAAGITQAELHDKTPIGKAGAPRSTIKRAIRWRQQELKALGLIERVPGRRGVWRLAESASPPYPLQTPRAYGNVVDERAYVDWIIRALEPAVSRLIPGGSIALNVGQDIFNPGSPARSLYRERLVSTASAPRN